MILTTEVLLNALLKNGASDFLVGAYQILWSTHLLVRRKYCHVLFRKADPQAEARGWQKIKQ